MIVRADCEYVNRLGWNKRKSGLGGVWVTYLKINFGLGPREILKFRPVQASRTLSALPGPGSYRPLSHVIQTKPATGRRLPLWKGGSTAVDNHSTLGTTKLQRFSIRAFLKKRTYIRLLSYAATLWLLMVSENVHVLFNLTAGFGFSETQTNIL
jgi:hypothetical protein